MDAPLLPYQYPISNPDPNLEFNSPGGHTPDLPSAIGEPEIPEDMSLSQPEIPEDMSLISQEIVEPPKNPNQREAQ